MKNELNIYYDEEGDFLELQRGNYKKGYFKNLGEGIFERRNEKTKEITGFAIHGFKKRTQKLKENKISLPFKIHFS